MSWKICPPSPYHKYSRKFRDYETEPQEPDIDWPGFGGGCVVPGPDEAPCSKPWLDPTTGLILQFFFEQVEYWQWSECNGMVQGDPNASWVYCEDFQGPFEFSRGNKDGWFYLGEFRTEKQAITPQNGHIYGGIGTGQIQVEIDNPIGPYNEPKWLQWIEGDTPYDASWSSGMEYDIGISKWGHVEYEGIHVIPALIALGGMLLYATSAAQVVTGHIRRRT